MSLFGRPKKALDHIILKIDEFAFCGQVSEHQATLWIAKEAL